jgi:hypothetical protein
MTFFLARQHSRSPWFFQASTSLHPKINESSLKRKATQNHTNNKYCNCKQCEEQKLVTSYTYIRVGA